MLYLTIITNQPSVLEGGDYMFNTTKKLLSHTAKLTNRTFDFTMNLMDRLSDSDDVLIKKGNTISRIASGTLIVSGIVVSTTINIKAGTGLIIGGVVSLTSNMIYTHKIKK